MPPDAISSSMRDELENTSTDGGTHLMALSSNAFVTDLRISVHVVGEGGKKRERVINHESHMYVPHASDY